MMTGFTYKIVDDIVPLEFQEKLKTLMLGDRPINIGSNIIAFPWFYVSDVTYGENAKKHNKNPALSHFFKADKDSVADPLLDYVIPIAYMGCYQAQYQYKSIIQARSFLQFPLSRNLKKSDIDLLHIDSTDPHLVVLYYVVDSDGDTILTSHKYNQGEVERVDLKAQDHEIIARVTPKQGRALIFNGSYYHTAEQPSNNIRCVINFDIA